MSGRLLICILLGQGPTVYAVGADGGCLDTFYWSIIPYFLSPTLSGRRPDID